MEYELEDEPNEVLGLRWLILIAIILWGGAWWLAQYKGAVPGPQGETTTAVDEQGP